MAVVEEEGVAAVLVGIGCSQHRVQNLAAAVIRGALGLQRIVAEEKLASNIPVEEAVDLVAGRRLRAAKQNPVMMTKLALLQLGAMCA